MNNEAIDKNNPKRVYFDDQGTENADSEDAGVGSEDISNSLSMKNMFGNDVTYDSYKEAVKKDGKTVDVCIINLTDVNGRTMKCNAYVDRETQALQKIDKIIDENNIYDYSMTIEPATDADLQEPSWISECVEASEEDSWDLFGIVMLMSVFTSGQDLTNGVQIDMTGDMQIDNADSETELYVPSDEEAAKMEEILEDREYWEERIGSYSGSFRLNNRATVYDADGGEHDYIWNSETEEFDEHSNEGYSYEAENINRTYEDTATTELTFEENSSDEATIREQKRRSFAYWKDKLGSYGGQKSNESGTSLIVYDSAGNSHYFDWNDRLLDYVERY